MNAKPSRVDIRRHLPWAAAIVAVLAVAACGGRSDTPEGFAAEPKQLRAETIAARQHYFGTENVDAATGAVRSDRVIFSWTGVSSFAAAFNGHVVLLDGWIARGSPCYPHLASAEASVQLALCPTAWPHSMDYVGSTDAELAALAPRAYFFGHAHFDHAGDLPTVIQANPEMVVFGTQEHCDDITGETVLDMPTFECVAVFESLADMGTMAALPADTLPGVEVTAVKQPHSVPGERFGAAASGDGSTQSLHLTRAAACEKLEAFPVQPREPMTWLAPRSGSVAIAWHFRIGDFAVMWQDTTGPIRSGTEYTSVGVTYDGAQVSEAFQSLPRPDVRLAHGSSKDVLLDHLRALNYPKVFIPIHGDLCFNTLHPQIQQYLEEELPADQRPIVRFLHDPEDYIYPITFDPASPQWRD